MPGVIDPETMYADDLPGIWSPVQWEMTDEERIKEVEKQATASLLWAVNVPEAILRLLLKETAIERVYKPPKGFDPDMQGDWMKDLITFAFKRPIKLVEVDREPNSTYVEFDFGEVGAWSIEIEPEKITIERV